MALPPDGSSYTPPPRSPRAPRLNPGAPPLSAPPPALVVPSSVPAPTATYDPQAVAEARAKLLALIEAGQPDTTDDVPDWMQTAPASYITEDEGIVGMESRYNADVDAAQTTLDEALRVQRAHIMGTQRQVVNPETGEPTERMPRPGNIAKKTEPMSWDEYQALAPLQRAAVDFNTSLVSAVRRDRKLQDQYDPNDRQTELYDASVERLFGEDRGSLMYAPETVALLKRIDYQDPNADLDDFLGLRAAIHKRDLEQLTRYTSPVRGDTPVTDRQDVVRQLALNTETIEQELAKSTLLLQSMTATMRNDRNTAPGGVSDLGGIVRPVNLATGYDTPTATNEMGEQVSTLDGIFQTSFDMLARKDADVDALITSLYTGATDQQIRKWEQYVQTRTANAANYGLDLGGEEGTKYLTADQLRVKMGLDKQKGADDG